MQALVSIHDVMPHTLKRVDRIIGRLEAMSLPPVTLLVVPGRPWEPEQIRHLRQLAAAGHELAAHGWQHQTRPRRLGHRLHAALISRQVAEHLDLDSSDILDLMRRSRQWFGQNDLPLPDFYVPPAWALGPITKSDLLQVPYHMIETTTGLHRREQLRSSKQNASNDSQPTEPFSFQKLPLTGYEADSACREFFLCRWNRHQIRSAQRKNLPLRISLHPDDLELRVADQIDQHIRAVKDFLRYADLP